MRKLIACFFVLLLTALPEEGFSEDGSIYVPSDHLKVPSLGKEWKVKLGEGKTRVEYTQRPQKEMQGGEYKSSIKLIREPLNAGDAKRPVSWQRKVTRDLKNEFEKVETEKLENSLYQADYAYTEDLIPVSGSRLYYSHDRWLYEWQCDLEKGLGWDADQWCYDQFQKIKWPDQLAVDSSKHPGEFQDSVRKFPLDDLQLKKIEEKILSAFQRGSVSLDELHKYGYFLIFKSLFFPPSDKEAKSVLLDDLDRLADTLEPFPQSVAMAAWLRAHRDYLEGGLAYSEIEELVHLDKPPPYWLLSLWVEPVNTDTSIYLARRQMAKLPLHYYVLGKVLISGGRAHDAIPFLKKAAGQKNILSINELARAYLKTEQIKQARNAAKMAIDRAPDNIDSWLLYLLAMAKEDEDLEEIEEIYDHLIAKESLSREDRIKIYLQRAQTSLHPASSLAFYQQVLDLDPNHLESLYSVGRLYMLEKNDKEKGMEFFERYLDTAPRGDERVAELVKMVRDLRVEIHGSVWKKPEEYTDYYPEFRREMPH